MLLDPELAIVCNDIQIKNQVDSKGSALIRFSMHTDLFPAAKLKKKEQKLLEPENFNQKRTSDDQDKSIEKKYWLSKVSYQSS